MYISTNTLISKQGFRRFFLFLFIFVISYITTQFSANITNIKLISAIDLDLFSFWLSLTILMVILLLEGDKTILCIRLTDSSLSKFMMLGIGAVTLIYTYETMNIRPTLFKEWNLISPPKLFFFLVTFLAVLYAPSYILHKIVFQKFRLNIIEKISFYPVLSAIIFVLIKVIETMIRTNIPNIIVFITILGGAFIVLLIENFRISNHSSFQYIINLKEIMSITVAIGFNLFVFYSAIGCENAFLRGDMWGDAHRVVFLNKYGLEAYISSPVEDYPPLYSIFWSKLLSILPFPYLNGLIIIAFFNHILSVLSFYTVAKILFKDFRKASLSIFLWTTLSGFSWTYLISNPPPEPLSGKKLLEYISLISIRYGKYSGSIVSPIYADGHALTRLWSLYLFFISISALLKACSGDESLKDNLLIFSICFIQIILGHMSEIPLISLFLFLLILVKKRHSSRFIKITFLTTLVLSFVSIFFTVLLFNTDKVYILISLTPLFAVSSAIILCKVSDILNNVISFRYLSKKIKDTFFILFLYIYGLMWFAYLNSHININWPIITLWYFPAVEWGVLGLISILAITKFIFKKTSFGPGLKIVITMFFSQLILLISINFLNYNFFYIHTPYPFQPIFFHPVLALIASHIFPIVQFNRNNLNKFRFYLVTVFIIIIFSFGSLDHILSASYWKTNSGWWLNKPLYPSKDDYELINFLYEQPSTSLYEFIATFYDWRSPSSYVVYPSGVAVLSRPLIEIFSYTNDSKEIYILSQSLPIRYILLLKKSPPQHKNSFLLHTISVIDPIFSNSKYELYLVNQFNFSRTVLLPRSHDFLTVEKIFFRGNLTFIDGINNNEVHIRNSEGCISPIGEGKVQIDVRTENITTGIVAFTPFMNISGKMILIKMKSTWGYFRDFGCKSEKIIIFGQTSFKIFNSVRCRIYIERFNYKGKCSAYSFSDHLRRGYAKEMIKDYLRKNYIDPIGVITSTTGIIWTIFAVLLTIITLFRNDNLYLKLTIYHKSGIIMFKH